MGRSSSSSRKKKRSKVRTLKKSKKYRSKKLRHHVSYDDDDSRSSMSSSSYSSSSEDSKYRSSKRSRIRVKKHVVSRKKKSKRTYSSESSEDDHRVKRKRDISKRKRDHKNKDKTYSKKKKKRRREDSVSSTSRSWSCSSCRSDSISSLEDRKKHGKNERDGRESENVERASKRVRYRPTSPLCSDQSDSSEYWVNEQVSVENNSRRLRSVITVVRRDEEDREMMNQDEHKEEIVYDLDDYPSCRSNESNDNGSPVDREKKIMSENAKEVNDDNVSDGEEGSNCDSDELGKAKMVNEPTSGETNSDDLELILRQRALENLLKFRGVRVSVKDGSNTVSANSTMENDPEMVNATKIRSARVIVEKDSQTDETVMDTNTGQNDPLPTKPKVAGSSNENVNVGISVAKQKLVRPALTDQLSKPNSGLSQARGQPEPRTELQSIRNNLDQICNVTASSSIENREKNGIDLQKANNSAAEEPSSPSSDKLKHEANEGSQFEQKTMSVMRGGEMVQVSYKVYIPKKAPALARRQFKR